MRSWIAVPKPTISQATPAPPTAMPTSTSGRLDDTNAAMPTAKASIPSASRFASPKRRNSRAETMPPAIAPAPCSELRTPKNDAGRCRP